MTFLKPFGEKQRGVPKIVDGVFNYDFRLIMPYDRILICVLAILSIVGVGLLALMSTENAIASVQRGESSFGVIAFPIWPGRVAVAVGLWLLCLQFFLDLLRAALGRARENSGQTVV